MRSLNFYWILISCSLFIFSGTAGAHPHELGKMDHGPSLESYQVDTDFSANHLTKDWSEPNIALAAKSKNDKRFRDKNPDENKIRPESQQIRKQQKQKEQKN